jgi:hypothetical protein
MKSRFSVRAIAAALMVSGVASTSVVSPANAAMPGEAYVPFLPILYPFLFVLRPVQHECAPSAGNVGMFVTRDVHVSNYDGWSIDSAKLRYSASASGEYSYRLVVRHMSRSGDIITKSELKTVNVNVGELKDVTVSFSNSYVGNAQTLSISHEDVSGPGTLYMNRAAGACANTLLTDSDGTGTHSLDVGLELRGDEDHYTNNVVEYFVPAYNKFFITAHVNDQAALDASPDFIRTGRSFRIPRKQTYGNVIDVYRFFSPEAISHVYVDKTGHDFIVANPGFNLNNEGIDFGSVKPDIAGKCPSWAPHKIYRSYNSAPIVNQRNHRYTNKLVDYNAMTASGWAPEGPAFCAYSIVNPL